MAIDQGTASTKVTLQRKLFKHTVCGDQLVVELDQTGVVQRISGTVHPGLEEKRLGRPMYPAVSVEDAKRTAVAYDTSLMPFKPISEVSCYLPSRNGIPLVHKLTYEKDGQLITIMIHSMTGRIIQ
ncbi:hypothetical protein AB4114_09880 [Paenibacillus sp. 2RAB27]|uniref:hypothetical protein n=1 Tax=Paenibacillus sp. 2RAB27 TaxID=3232991 RepID=UPI003F9AB62D